MKHTPDADSSPVLPKTIAWAFTACAQTGHPIYLAVLGAIVVPRSKHRLDRHLELLDGSEKRATMFRIHRLVIQSAPRDATSRDRRRL